jgi:hypothetical protein
MIPPKNTVVNETLTSVFWFDENGILCTVSKKGNLTPEETKSRIINIRKMLGDKKVCMLIDATDSSPLSKEVKDIIAEDFPKFVKALGIISDSALGKMLVNLFLNLKEQSYPIKMFNEEEEARKWLKQFL